MARATLLGGLARLSWRLGTVVELVTETPTVSSLVFDVPDWPGHVAGQHVDIRLTAEDGYQAERSYSIASPPDEPQLALTIERLEDGEVSTYLVGVVQAGDKVELRGPIGGYFAWRGDEGRPLMLIAGGSGIVPLMAMIRHRAAASIDVPVRLLYSSRSYEDVIYRDELDRLAADGGLAVSHTLTRSQPGGWSGYSRRIDGAMVADVAWPTDQEPLAFICGPTPFVETAAGLLVERGYDEASVKTERFGPTGG